MKVLSIINLKGGVAKTISSVNMAHILAAVKGFKVLLIDNDKQGNASKIMNRHSYDHKGTAEVMTQRGIDPAEVIQHTDFDGLDIITANMNLLTANLEVMLDQSRPQQTRFKKFLDGFVSWGNYTACYPANTDVTDYFYCINRMFKWVAKTLILTYWNYIDRGIKRRLIDAVVQSINDWLASLATDEKIIGGRVEFNESENSTSQLAAGIVRFHIYMTPPSPMQKMDFVLEYDLSYLAALVAA